MGDENTQSQTNGNALEWSFNSASLANKTAILFSLPTCNTCATDVSGRVIVSSSGLAYSIPKQSWVGSVTVTNTSAQPIAQPIELVFAGLPTGVTVTSPAGTTGGNPYLLLPGSAALAAGQSATVSVTFHGPSTTRVTYRVVTYSGGF